MRDYLGYLLGSGVVTRVQVLDFGIRVEGLEVRIAHDG